MSNVYTAPEEDDGKEKEKKKSYEPMPNFKGSEITLVDVMAIDNRSDDDPTRLIDDFFALFNPFKAIEGMFLLSKLNPFKKVQAAEHILSQVFKKKNYELFQCMDCATDIVKSLQSKGINGDILDIVTNGNKGMAGNIWSDALQTNIATNGRHRAILVGGKVYDNLNPNGIIYDKWIKDFFSPTGFKVNTTKF